MGLVGTRCLETLPSQGLDLGTNESQSIACQSQNRDASLWAAVVGIGDLASSTGVSYLGGCWRDATGSLSTGF